MCSPLTCPAFRSVSRARAGACLLRGPSQGLAVERLEAEAGGTLFHEVERAVEMTVVPQGRGFGPVSLGGEWCIAPSIKITPGGDRAGVTRRSMSARCGKKTEEAGVQRSTSGL